MATDPVPPATRPLVLPEKFSGDGEWTQWICHFENVAAVNSWNDDNKLLWLKVRLTERAQLAFQHLPTDTQASYAQAKEALKERFEPESRKDRYKAEFQTRRKKRTEGWADYGEDLRVLVDKAYPHLEAAARDQMALTHFLSQIDNAQVAFSVKQQKPTTLDAAISATLEMESYLGPKVEVAAVNDAESDTAKMMKKLLDRMDRLETELSATRKEREEFMTQRGSLSGRATSGTYRGGSRRVPTCWGCGKRGHVIQNCWSQESRQQPPTAIGQGNEPPSVDRANH